ncbi:hypothetical protein F5Y10DRAFT_239779, partial [Nemania abortiva]
MVLGDLVRRAILCCIIGVGARSIPPESDMFAIPTAYRFRDAGAIVRNGPRQTEVDKWQADYDSHLHIVCSSNISAVLSKLQSSGGQASGAFCFPLYC